MNAHMKLAEPLLSAPYSIPEGGGNARRSCVPTTRQKMKKKERNKPVREGALPSPPGRLCDVQRGGLEEKNEQGSSVFVSGSGENYKHYNR